MNEFRLRTTGAIITLADLRAMYVNRLIPDNISNQEFEIFGIDPVLPAPPPMKTEFQDIERDGVKLDDFGNWVQKWRIVEWPADVIAETISNLRKNIIICIDRDTDDIYRAAIGNRGMEYDKANNEARSYKAAGYTGAVPASVSSWATAKTWTPQQATDDIIVAASRLDSARDAIRANRLLRKEEARAARSYTALKAIEAQWNSFVLIIKTQLGI